MDRLLLGLGVAVALAGALIVAINCLARECRKERRSAVLPAQMARPSWDGLTDRSKPACGDDDEDLEDLFATVPRLLELVIPPAGGNRVTWPNGDQAVASLVRPYVKHLLPTTILPGLGDIWDWPTEEFVTDDW